MPNYPFYHSYVANRFAEELSRWIGKKLLWLHRKLALKEEAAPRLRAPEYVSGEAFCYLGRRYRLKIVERQERPLEFDGTRFSLRRDAVPEAEAQVRNWYVTAGADWLKRRVETLSARDVIRQDIVDIMLLSTSNLEQLAIREGLFAESAIIPAARANDTSDVWVMRGGRYTSLPSRPL